MALTTQERIEVTRSIMRLNAFPPSVTKTQIFAAVGAADDWTDSVQATYLQALPAAYRLAGTPAQLAGLLAFVLQKRYGSPIGNPSGVGG